MKVFASSDHHFYHKNIIKYAERPFDIEDENCVIDCAKHMIEKHNETVSNDDVVIFVGDLSAGLRDRVDHFKQLIGLLQGKKILIRGNHDHQPDEFYLEAGIIAVHDYLEIGRFFISHYPCYESRWIAPAEKEHLKIINRDHCDTVIHGHIHNKDPNLWDSDGIHRINACVDYIPNGYKPIELDYPEIKDFFKNY